MVDGLQFTLMLPHKRNYSVSISPNSKTNFIDVESLDSEHHYMLFKGEKVIIFKNIYLSEYLSSIHSFFYCTSFTGGILEHIGDIMSIIQ